MLGARAGPLPRVGRERAGRAILACAGCYWPVVGASGPQELSQTDSGMSL